MGGLKRNVIQNPNESRTASAFHSPPTNGIKTEKYFVLG